MRQGIRFPGLCLAVATAALSPALAAAATTGVPLEVQISPISSQTRVVVHFTGAKASGWIKAHPGSEALAAGVRFNGSVLTFSPPAASLPAGGSGAVTFSTGLVLSGPAGGQAVTSGATVTLKTSFGTTTTQGGRFALTVPKLPPTCTLGPCVDWKPGQKPTRCDDRPGSNCYLYDSQFMCCTVCPTGC